MESQIKITLPEVNEVAIKIRTINEEIFDVLSNVRKNVNELNTYWQSDTSNVFQEHFEKFSQVFLEEKDVLERYASFLDETVSNYDSIESTMKLNAENF